MFVFSVNVVAIPVNNIIFIFLRKLMQGVYLVFNDLFPRASLQKICPWGRQVLACYFWSVKVPMVDYEGPWIHIIAGEPAEHQEDHDGVDAADENGTLTQFDVPELCLNKKERLS